MRIAFDWIAALRQHFDGNGLLQEFVLCFIDDAHSAPPQSGFEVVNVRC